MLIQKKEKNNNSSKSSINRALNYITTKSSTKRLLILSAFLTYTFGISYISSSDALYKKISQMLYVHLSARLIIPESYRNKLRILTQPNIGINYLKGAVTPIEKIRLDIKFLDYQKLGAKRIEALSTMTLISNDDDYVPATLSDSRKKIKVKVRLKGDGASDHLSGNKWSFRVKANKGKTILGMNKFSLQSPKVRNYLWEWLYHKLLKYENLPAIKYDFVELTVNGDNRGVYAVEQHFDKILLESNKFKEGPIIKLSEANYWMSRSASKKAGIPGPDEKEFFYQSEPDVFKKKKVLNNPNLYMQYLKASQLLSGFHIGSLSTSEVFDIDALAKFMAITDLTNSSHALIWRNMRFYYDPVLSKLIPIGFDAAPSSEPIKALNFVNTDLRFYDDQLFMSKYISALERISNPAYLDYFFNKINSSLLTNEKLLYRSYPALKSNYKGSLYRNQKIIKDRLNPPSPLNIYFKSLNKNNINITVGNKQYLPIEIISISDKNNVIYELPIPIKIKPRSKSKFTEYSNIQLNIPSEVINKIQLELDYIKFSYRIPGTKYISESKIIKYPRLNPLMSSNDIVRRPANHNSFKFIETNTIDKTIKFVPGEWILDKTLILPRNYTIKAGPGVTLILDKFAMIYSRSPIKFIGQKENPVTIKSRISGQGIVVSNVKDKSILNNVRFENLNAPSTDYWGVPGAVTFYQAPVDINNCIFIGSRSEDSLNIVRSNFSILNTDFIGSYSDAVDIDYSNGEISNLTINRSGNDGLDISASQINATKIKIDSAGDKGISAGEGSELNASRVYINNSYVALASKDISVINGSGFSISSSEIGLAAFKKKEEYGPASIIISNLEFRDINKLYLSSKLSKININGQRYHSNTSNKKINLIIYKDQK